MDDKDKYIERAKKVEKRINNYSKEAERLINHLSDLTIEFITELSSLKKHDKKRRAYPPFLINLKAYFLK